MIGGGIWCYNVKHKENCWISSQAKIIDIQKSNTYSSEYNYIVWVEFFVKDQIYQVTLPKYNRNMKIGNMVTIYYDPKNPKEIINSSF